MLETNNKSTERWNMIKQKLKERTESVGKSGFDDLYVKATYLAVCSNYKANIYRFLHIVINLIIIVSGVTIGTSYFALSSLTWISILGYVVSVLKVLDELFDLGDAALHFKLTSTKCFKIARSIKPLKNSLHDAEEIRNNVERIYEELDEIELSIFQCGLSPINNNQ